MRRWLIIAVLALSGCGGSTARDNDEPAIEQIEDVFTPQVHGAINLDD